MLASLFERDPLKRASFLVAQRNSSSETFLTGELVPTAPSGQLEKRFGALETELCVCVVQLSGVRLKEERPSRRTEDINQADQQPGQVVASK